VENRLRARISALAEAEPALADDLALRGALIEIVDRAEPGSVDLRLPADVARARLAAGVPLLDRLDLPIPSSASSLVKRLTVAMLADPAARRPAEAFLEALRGHRLHADQLVGESVVGHDDHLAALAASADLSPGLVASASDLAARAMLSEVARRLRPALALGAWDRAYCPVCGGRAIFGERGVSASASPSPACGGGGRGVGGTLRCGRCATAWAWALHRCLDCKAGRLKVIDTTALPERDGWRLAVCDSCRAYLKIAPTARSDRLADLLVDDLVTRPLDRLALERGHERQAGAGYRLEQGEPAGEELDLD
jgi:FdhE protein